MSKIANLRGKKGKKFSGLSLILVILVIVLGCVLIASIYFFFDFLASFSMPKAIPAGF